MLASEEPPEVSVVVHHSSCSSSSDENVTFNFPVQSPAARAALYILMSAFFFCFNGVNFVFFTFLTVLARHHPALALTKTAGARATTVFFVSSTTARMVS